MNLDDILQRLRVLTREITKTHGDICVDTHHQELGFDSLAIVELVFAIEREWDVRIADHEAEGFTTLRSVANHVMQLRAE